MPLRFLVIDAAAASRGELGDMLRARWPDAAIDEWDPAVQGGLSAALSRGPAYDAVLLEAHPADDGARWTQDLREGLHQGRAEAPPVVLLADAGDTHFAIQALKAGAADFLRRTGLTADKLARTLAHALTEHEARRRERADPDSVLSRTQPVEMRRLGAPAADAPEIPGYRALRRIGRGGMAQVYLAERAADGFALVLKVMDPSLRRDPLFLQRFVREYKLLASVKSEHVARIYDQGFAGNHPYIAMEYLSGGTLAARIQDGLTSLQAVRICAQIAKALDVIHGHGIVHRDLKPQNILFRDTGRPVIVDFGLAKDLAADTALTRHGEVLATPRYMSPEQCLAQPVDARSDLYSLGVVFYEMLTGQRLWDKEGPASLVYAHLHADVPRLAPRLAGYQPILDRLLAKKPADRFQSARELFATIAV